MSDHTVITLFLHVGKFNAMYKYSLATTINYVDTGIPTPMDSLHNLHVSACPRAF